MVSTCASTALKSGLFAPQGPDKYQQIIVGL
jgi:hypothetical protein